MRTTLDDAAATAENGGFHHIKQVSQSSSRVILPSIRIRIKKVNSENEVS